MKLEISIPTELSEIKLSQYQSFLKIAKDNDDAEFLNQKMVQTFCNIDLKDVAEIKYKDVVEITASIGRMFNVQSHKFINRFKLGGVEFGFIPDLDDMTFGEYTDLDSYIGDWDNMHKAMAVLYRPIKKKGLNNTYEIEKYNGSITYSDVMKHAPLDVVFGANVFFYNLGNELLKSTMNYLEQNKQMQTILQQHNLENDGVGIHQSMLSLKVMLQDLIQLPNYQLTNV
ncbi:hypothetical protein UFOVP387_6 [uncultured Caudovirales phage]|uniref:Uncharacterized protein n=1 Tax=uncultured Caudovirales phage TaxID=2100421 RepID=A0A6J7X3W0_9CAUD|nr:hypothetical protein UFOVP387_6 [uncultured Caudovirales phage]